MTEWIFVIMCLIIIVLLFMIFYGSYREKKLLKALDSMLNQALDGEFKESSYNESMLSAIEHKMARVLSANYLSKTRMEEERNRIKTLISDISHQTKTPIANLILYSEILKERNHTGENDTIITEINSQSEKLKFLIEYLVKISRLEQGIIQVKPEVQNIDMLLQALYNEMKPKAEERGITLNVEHIDAVLPYDYKWTLEALENIVDNGIKYSKDGGKVSVFVQAFEMFFCIHIEDEGIGITEAEQASIFTRFYRSKDVTRIEGIGVGLYLAREIISSQGGYIKVGSVKGRGSKFSVYLQTRSVTPPDCIVGTEVGIKHIIKEKNGELL